MAFVLLEGEFDAVVFFCYAQNVEFCGRALSIHVDL